MTQFPASLQAVTLLLASTLIMAVAFLPLQVDI